MSGTGSSSAAVRGGGSRRRRRTAVVGTGTAVLLGVGAFAAVDVARAPGAAASQLRPFDGCDELAAWYRDAALEQLEAPGSGWGDPRALAVAAESVAGGDSVPAPEAAADAGTGEAVGSSDTGTNVQEAGVDEPAAVKTDGSLAYTLSGSRLVVADVTGAPALLGGVDLAPVVGEATPAELLLLGDRVVVVGTGWLPADGDGAAVQGLGTDAFTAAADTASLSMPWPGPGTSTTVVVTVDVSDPAAPAVVDSVELEGGYVSARAAGGAVRLVTTSRPALPLRSPYEPLPGEDLTDPAVDVLGEDEALRLNRETIRSLPPESWLPQLVQRADDGTVTRAPALGCADVSRPATGAGLGTVTVLTLDPDAAAGGLVVDTDGVSADGDLVYASADRLYVATTQGGWWWGPREDVTTELHGFDVGDPRSTAYVASGSVDGWLLGRWALSAQDGHLRVATTTQGTQQGTTPDTQSSVFVLQESAGTLAQVGRVDGLGPGEQIRSVRWFGDLALVVTFRQTDPLYTVDLSDVAAPRVLGELKVTGYSAYLHPLGGDQVLGVGQEATPDGMTVGAKVELYDVSDLAAPTAVSNVVWESSSSAAEWDSRLFTYLPEARTAVLPLERYTADSYRTGLVAVAVDEAGAVTETGSWTIEDAGYLVSLASTGTTVLAVTETYDQLTGAPARSLTVLTADGLAVRGQVPLG